MKGDSIESIYDTLKNSAMIIKTAGGISPNIHYICATGHAYRFLLDCFTESCRLEGSMVTRMISFQCPALMILPLVLSIKEITKDWAHSRYVCIEPWQGDMLDFIDFGFPTFCERWSFMLRLTQPILSISMKRVEANADSSLFCPNEAPGLLKSMAKNSKFFLRDTKKKGARGKLFRPEVMVCQS